MNISKLSAQIEMQNWVSSLSYILFLFQALQEGFFIKNKR